MVGMEDARRRSCSGVAPGREVPARSPRRRFHTGVNSPTSKSTRGETTRVLDPPDARRRDTGEDSRRLEGAV